MRERERRPARVRQTSERTNQRQEKGRHKKDTQQPVTRLQRQQ